LRNVSSEDAETLVTAVMQESDPQATKLCCTGVCKKGKKKRGGQKKGIDLISPFGDWE
jgi:hypothetical protein